MRLRVAINAQLHHRDAVGGVATALIGLVWSLGALGGAEEYVIIVCPPGVD